jgi:Holliday junction DNA helicase RuvB
LTLKAWRHLGLTGPARSAVPELPLFEEDDPGRREGNG